MDSSISREEFDNLMKIDGEIRGTSFIDGTKFIYQKNGQAGVKKIENELDRIGYKFRFDEVKPLAFYPLGLSAVLFEIEERLLGFKKEDFQAMGVSGIKSPLIIRLFIKYFASPENILKKIPDMWQKYHNTGDLKAVEFDADKRYLTLRLENFNLHPAHCQYLNGYFSKSAILMGFAGEGSVSCEETACTYRGDKYHEFFIHW